MALARVELRACRAGAASRRRRRPRSASRSRLRRACCRPSSRCRARRRPPPGRSCRRSRRPAWAADSRAASAGAPRTATAPPSPYGPTKRAACDLEYRSRSGHELKATRRPALAAEPSRARLSGRAVGGRAERGGDENRQRRGERDAFAEVHHLIYTPQTRATVTPGSVEFGVEGTRCSARACQSPPGHERSSQMSLLWIILIVVLVLALLGFFGRGRF